MLLFSGFVGLFGKLVDSANRYQEEKGAILDERMYSGRQINENEESDLLLIRGQLEIVVKPKNEHICVTKQKIICVTIREQPTKNNKVMT